jgi:DNA-binding CsgD family transcriptional regulator
MPKRRCSREQCADQAPIRYAPLLLHVERLPHPLTDSAGCVRSAVAVVARPPEAVEALDLFRRHYGMTPAEARLATLIATGCSLLDAAAAMNISRNTVRTHMKHVYAKTELRRQVDLVRLLGSGSGGVH